MATYPPDTFGHLKAMKMRIAAWCACGRHVQINLNAMSEEDLRKPNIGKAPKCTAWGRDGHWSVGGEGREHRSGRKPAATSTRPTDLHLA